MCSGGQSADGIWANFGGEVINYKVQVIYIDVCEVKWTERDFTTLHNSA